MRDIISFCTLEYNRCLKIYIIPTFNPQVHDHDMAWVREVLILTGIIYLFADKCYKFYDEVHWRLLFKKFKGLT